MVISESTSSHSADNDIVSIILDNCERALPEDKAGVEAACLACSPRLFHGRGQCYEACNFINVDLFYPLLLITSYQALSAELVETLGKSLWQRFHGCGVDCVALQQRRGRDSTIQVLAGELPERNYAYGNGLKFSLDITDRQNIGFFMDMVPGHQWMMEHARGKTVLNLFAYTCAFSVAAIKGGAQRVVNIDKSKAALGKGLLNHHLNRLDASKAGFFGHDIFSSVGKLTRNGPYDVVVIDPPTFQKGSFDIKKDYARLLRHLPKWAAPQCDVLACVNTPSLDEDYLQCLMKEVFSESDGMTCHFVQRLANRADLPEKFPQRNVKILHYRLGSSGS